VETKRRKQQIDELVLNLARSDSTEAKWAKALFILLLEDATDRLVDAVEEDFRYIQGEARIMQKIDRLLNAAKAALRDTPSAGVGQ
jgi:hypothetical protein